MAIHKLERRSLDDFINGDFAHVKHEVGLLTTGFTSISKEQSNLRGDIHSNLNRVIASNTEIAKRQDKISDAWHKLNETVLSLKLWLIVSTLSILVVILIK